MAHATSAVPLHLRRFVVEQDGAAYNAIDQAVWRFVLLQMHARLVETAHPVYREGLAATGLSVDRIPSVAEMNDRMSRFGWGAVCVDGFIPPRAFQEFQACGILPIAAEIRTREHLVYTPAPDIIHEAAGHAPILPEPAFSGYLRRIGELGAQAFTVPEEDRVFQAIRALSEAKEDPALTGAEVAGAEAELVSAVAAVPSVSEAARLSRLYWWTAEYGLVGRVDDYKIYGAGLLSSLGESQSCHAPEVRKVPLDERCLDLPYDITRPQPQLFVTPSFEALHEVLDRVARTMAVSVGGELALGRALASRELASVACSSGAWVQGVLAELGPRADGGSAAGGGPAWLAFDGPSVLVRDGAIFSWSEADRGGDLSSARAPDRALARRWILPGRLADGRMLERLDDAAVDAHRTVAADRWRFTLASGVGVEGRVQRRARTSDGRLFVLDLADARLELPGQPPVTLPRHELLAAGEVVTARAGSVVAAVADDAGSVASGVDRAAASAPAPRPRVPKPRRLPQREQRLLALYERAERAARDTGSSRAAFTAAFEDVHATLERDYPDEWLARWNVLETLSRRAPSEPLSSVLRIELERLEVAFGHREPIASGLRYLARTS
jgi:phenylalanine-4-hydroxylase